MSRSFPGEEVLEAGLKELALSQCLENRREVGLERKAAFGPDLSMWAEDMHEGKIFMTV